MVGAELLNAELAPDVREVLNVLGVVAEQGRKRA